MLPDYYNTLGIPQDASDMEIKKAYRKCVRATHPDLIKSNKSFDEFMLVNEAYEILIHHNTRDIYNQDYKTSHDPMVYEAYYHWINVARDRALKHSKMMWKEFAGTDFYKHTQTTPYIIHLVGLMLGIILLMSGIGFTFILKDNQALGVVLFFVLVPIGVFLLLQSFAGMRALKRYH